MSVMNRLLTISIYALLFLVAGCYLGDPIAHRTVALDFPVQQQQTNVILSATDPEIQEAFRIIDEAFVANGFARDKNPPPPEDQAQGIIAAYGRYNVSLRDTDLLSTLSNLGSAIPARL